MNNAFKTFICLLIITSTAFGNFENISKQAVIDKFRDLISGNSRLLKISTCMGLATLGLFLCYRLTHKKALVVKQDEESTDTPADASNAETITHTQNRAGYTPYMSDGLRG